MDRTALTRVFTVMRGHLRTVAARIAGESEADDALQDAFCRLWRKADAAPSDSDIGALSLTAVRNRSIDMARWRQRHAVAEFSEAISTDCSGESGNSDAAELFLRVRRIIERELPRRQREVLWMRDYEQLSFAEIAESLSTTEANVRQILSRARRQVRDIYRKTNTDDYGKMD